MSFFNSVPSVSVAEAAQKTRAVNTAFIDVRTPEEYSAGHARGAVNMPLSTLGKHAHELVKFDSVYVICQSGGRSSSATSQLLARKINAINVAGGTLAWKAGKLPLE